MTERELKEKIEIIKALETVAFAYSELAGQRLGQIRFEIEKNRSFVAEISSLFHIVKTAAENQKASTDLGKRGTINLLITSNQRFYGGLEKRLLEFYAAYSVLTYAKTIVVGLTGERFLEAADLPINFESLHLKKDVPTTEEMEKIVNLVLPFEKINVYHTKMQSILVQKPVVLEVGGISDIPLETNQGETYFIFEPEIMEMLKFFDRKIVQVLIAQAFYESELARTAARMVSMEQSKLNAKKEINRLNNRLFLERGNMLTFRMLEIVSAFGKKSHES